MKLVIFDEPCIKHFDSTKLIKIRTNFSSFGFGFVVLQPSDDAASISSAQDYRSGKGYTFMTKESKATLHPVCFGARKTRGNEARLHSHLDEGFSGDWGINKCRHYVYG